MAFVPPGSKHDPAKNEQTEIRADVGDGIIALPLQTKPPQQIVDARIELEFAEIELQAIAETGKKRFAQQRGKKHQQCQA